MRIPKYINKYLDRRAMHAAKFFDYGYEVDQWLKKNGIEIDSYDGCTGVESIVNPYESIERIREAIVNKE